ncbi:MAG TPA: DUF2079 domain-containing protein [Streptosporangiaceae bacterium]|nr:DUF2079 domain-containing protein [Streptosporangiaceae bacterium]
MLEEHRAPSGDEAGHVEAPLSATPQGATPQSAALARLALVPPAALRKARTLPGVYRDPFVWATVAVVFCAYAAISLFRLLQLHPTSWDLGIFTEVVKQYANLRAPIVNIRGTGFNLLGDHFSPAVAVLAPFFRVFPSPATLLVAQALMAAASVFAVSRAAREKLGVGPSRVIAVAYGFSWGLQQLIEFDFHELALAVPLLAFSLSALVRGRIKAAVWWALPLVFVKEDQGFTVAAIGAYLIYCGLRAKGPAPAAGPGVRGVSGVSGGSKGLAGRWASSGVLRDADGGRRSAAGQFLLVWGFVWVYLAIGVIIPHFNPAHHYQYWSDGGVLAPGGHLSVTGALDQFFHAWPNKLDTVVMLLLPTAFIAVGSPIALIAVPSLLLRFESTNSAFWGTYWHYNATLMPILFIAAIDALARIQAAAHARDGSDGADGLAEWASGRDGPWRAVLAGARRYGAAMMLAITVPLAFQFPLSNLWNAGTYRISPIVASANAAMAKVPDGATVLTTLDLLAPLAARCDTYWIGNAGNPQTEYIVFDGDDSDYIPAISNVPAFVDGFYPPHTYTVIFHSGNVYVFRRTSVLSTGP